SRFTFHVLRFTFYASFFFAILLRAPSPAAAQTQSPTYWRYAASGRLTHIIAADMTGDGMDDFIVVDANGKVDLLDAGRILQSSYIAPESVLAVHPIDDQSERKIALGLRNRLILLTTNGDEIWQSRLTPIAAPNNVLTGGSLEAKSDWLAQYEAVPIALESLDWDNDGRHEILVLLSSGQLQLFDADGNLIWRYVRNTNPILPTEPHMAVGDLNGDGQEEIALGFFNPRLRFSQLALIDRNGRLLWDQEQPISGRLTALTLVTLNDQPAIAVGANLGHVAVYNADRQRLWLRTINVPVTNLIGIHTANGPGLAVGDNVGSVIAFDWQGRRSWTRHLAPDADRSILHLSAAPLSSDENQPALAAVVGLPDNADAPADVALLTGAGRTLDRLTAVEAIGPTQLTDLNGDRHNELLLSRFATVELLGLGGGANEIAIDWAYNLLGPPRSMLVVDFEQDGEDELLIGTEDGRIHRLNNDGSFAWVVSPGDAITHLASLPDPNGGAAQFIVARNKLTAETEDAADFQSWIAARRANGEQAWEIPLPTPITSLQVGELNIRGQTNIIVGAQNGDVIVYNDQGDEQWRVNVHDTVQRLIILRSIAPQETKLIAATPRQLYQISDSPIPQRIAIFQNNIQAVYPFNQSSANSTHDLLVFVAGGLAYGITTQGRRLPQWPLTIDGPPNQSLPAPNPDPDPFPKNTADSFLLTTDEGRLRRIVIENDQPQLSWLLTGLGNVVSLYWGDLESDGVPDMALGDSVGRVIMYTVDVNARRPILSERLSLGSRVFALTALRREDSQKSDLLAITQNGVAQLFRVQENRPPLLANPEIDVAQGRYSFVIAVNDVEQDNVTVQLDIFDPAAQQWVAQEEQRLTNGNGKLFWLVDAPLADESAETLGIQYRFHYDDGFHQGDVIPPAGPAPIPPPTLTNDPLIGLIILGVSGLIFTGIYLRQAQSPAAQARRFYRELSQDRATTLTRLENRYRKSDGSPDFLLSLANQARQQGETLVANLADGLFLLANRPYAGLPIIVGALAEIEQSPHRDWECLERWRQTHQLGRALLEAPSITELSLLRPQLEQMLETLEGTEHESPALERLLPILTNLRDSKRVKLAEDSLVYLNKAAVLLEEAGEDWPESQTSIEKMIAMAVVERWSGLTSAEIEELRGRADLTVTLKTKRLVLTDQTEAAVEIQNNGRAAAENIIAVLEDNPAYVDNGRPQTIPLLPPGRARQINFVIEPKVADRFRLVINLTYDDRNQRDKAISFGDMVHLLPPARDFKPIANPYLPGTPLRRDSAIFFGREKLFAFISENAGRLSQRNVLILIGQRRTGKTSILLRLEQHLPDDLLPVYIDCQSLGVTPGMPAFLHDLAWQITDTLAGRDIILEAPPPAAWQDDPTRLFQRQFLPQVKSLLPPETTLLLVFDEFEAFENLVRDGILPPTLFPYLRHLMQHSEGLSFVFVGARRLEEMSADYWSVLFNIALYQKIGYLEDEEATRLIVEPTTPNLVYDDLALDKILRVTAGHPYFLQLVCYTLVKRANGKRRSYVTISNVNAALDEMLSLGEMHFAYIWQRSTQAEKALLTAVSHLMDQDMSFHPTDMTQYLEPYGIHLAPAEVTAALKRLVERDILQEVTGGTTALYELKIGLVGLWVAKYKSLSHLYV
ncbi:MAG: AAA family ATPase, partial [Chloroflexi bacterium]|nr:AAA family ATPase [Chloroflexota bacterium]